MSSPSMSLPGGAQPPLPSSFAILGKRRPRHNSCGRDEAVSTSPLFHDFGQRPRIFSDLVSPMVQPPLLSGLSSISTSGRLRPGLLILLVSSATDDVLKSMRKQNIYLRILEPVQRGKHILWCLDMQLLRSSPVAKISSECKDVVRCSGTLREFACSRLPVQSCIVPSRPLPCRHPI